MRWKCNRGSANGCAPRSLSSSLAHAFPYPYVLGLELGQIVDVTRTCLRNHPEIRHWAAASLTVAAIKDAFCPSEDVPLVSRVPEQPKPQWAAAPRKEARKAIARRQGRSGGRKKGRAVGPAPSLTAQFRDVRLACLPCKPPNAEGWDVAPARVPHRLGLVIWAWGKWPWKIIRFVLRN